MGWTASGEVTAQCAEFFHLNLTVSKKIIQPKDKGIELIT